MVKVTSLLGKAGSGLRFSFGVKPWTEMEIRCVKGMHRLRLVSSENNSVFKRLICQHNVEINMQVTEFEIMRIIIGEYIM